MEKEQEVKATGEQEGREKLPNFFMSEILCDF